VLDETFYHAIHRCPSCGDISSHLVVDLRLKDGGSFHAPYHCTRCGTELIPVFPRELNGAPCPACRRKALTCEMTCLWD